MLEDLWQYCQKDWKRNQNSLKYIVGLQLSIALLLLIFNTLYALFNWLIWDVQWTQDAKDYLILSGSDIGQQPWRFLLYSFVQENIVLTLVLCFLWMRLAQPLRYFLGDKHVVQLYFISHLLGAFTFLLLLRYIDKGYVINNGLVIIIYGFIGAFWCFAPHYEEFLAPLSGISFNYLATLFAFYAIAVVLLQPLHRTVGVIYLVNLIAGYLYMRILQNSVQGISFQHWIKDSYHTIKKRSKDVRTHIQKKAKEKERSLEELFHHPFAPITAFSETSLPQEKKISEQSESGFPGENLQQKENQALRSFPEERTTVEIIVDPHSSSKTSKSEDSSDLPPLSSTPTPPIIKE